MRDKDHVKIHKCPSGAYILTKYPFICNLLLSVIQIHSNCNFGTNCPKSVSVKHGSGGISPVAAYRSEQPGAVCQECISTAVYRRLALDWRPRLFYFPAARRGISSRAATFPINIRAPAKRQLCGKRRGSGMSELCRLRESK